MDTYKLTAESILERYKNIDETFFNTLNFKRDSFNVTGYSELDRPCYYSDSFINIFGSKLIILLGHIDTDYIRFKVIITKPENALPILKEQHVYSLRIESINNVEKAIDIIKDIYKQFRNCNLKDVTL